MAFPVVEEITATEFDSDTTTHAVNLPATVNAGDLLILLAGFEYQATNATTSGPGGSWVEIYNYRTNNSRTVAYGLVAAGTEDGGTASVNTSANVYGVAHVYRIRQGTWEGTSVAANVASATTSGSSSDPDPPNLAPSWGAADTLWIAWASGNNNTTVSSYPSSYTNGTSAMGNGALSYVLGATARRELNAASENPGTFNYASNPSSWNATTIAIQPAAAAAGTPPSLTLLGVG